MRMKKNPFYTAPEAEFLDVWFEENFVNTGYHEGGGGSYGDGDTNENGDF